MVKLHDRNGQFFITIPKEYVTKLNWGKGEVLTISITEKNNLELANIKQVGGKELDEYKINLLKKYLGDELEKILGDEKVKELLYKK